MLKNFLKDTKYKPNRILTQQKSFQSSNTSKLSKPSIYLRVDKEKQRQKVFQVVQFRTELRLKRKYFLKIKFYHNIIQLRRRIKLSYKYSAFSIIKDHYINKREKYDYIIYHFIQLNKIKVFSALYKEHILISKKNGMLRDLLIQNFNHFKYIANKNIENNYQTFNAIRRFYFRLITNRILINGYTRACNEANIYKYKEMIKQRHQKKIIEQIKVYIKNKFKSKILKKMIAYEHFISTIKRQIKDKRGIKEATKLFLIKSIFSKLTSFANNLHILESKNNVAQMFYEEITKKKCLNYLRHKTGLNKSFRNLIKKYANHTKSLIKDKITKEKHKIMLMTKKYSRFKMKKLIPQKARFFKVALSLINRRKKNMIIQTVYIEKMRNKAWNVLAHNSNKRKSFNSFLKKFISIHNSIIMQNTLHLMRYKVHKFLQQGKLPQIITHYLQSKLESLMLKFKYKQMKKLYKKMKRHLLNRKMLQKKMHYACYFDSKRKKVKCYESFKRLMLFISCQKKVKQYEKKKLCLMLCDLPIKIGKIKQINEINRRWLSNSWFENIMFAYTIIHLDNIPFNKRMFFNWLIQLKQKGKSIPLLCSSYLGKTIIFILFKRLKRKMIQKIINNKYKKLLKESYIKRLINAKNSSIGLKQKFLLIKNECLNTLNPK